MQSYQYMLFQAVNDLCSWYVGSEEGLYILLYLSLFFLKMHGKQDSSAHRKGHHRSREHREHREERMREKRHHR